MKHSRPGELRETSKAWLPALAGLTVICLATLPACVTAQQQPGESSMKPRSHYTESGFRNRYPHPIKGAGDFMKFLADWARQEVKTAEFPLADNDPDFLKANRAVPTLTWIGHATFLIQFDGLNILTDPHLTARASPVGFAGPKRFTEPGLPFEGLPPIDIVVISHNHYDHLDIDTVTRLVEMQPQSPPQFFVPLGLESWFHDLGIHSVTEMDWWQETDFRNDHGSARIGPLPVQHFSGRGIADRNDTLWAGWLLTIAGKKFFFAGDTGYSKDFADIHERHGDIDFALIPIGAYEPRSFMRPMHVDPEEAVQIFQDLHARQAVGMHWGTFRLTLEDMDEPPRRLATALEAAGIHAERFFVMQHGETRRLDFLSESSPD